MYFEPWNENILLVSNLVDDKFFSLETYGIFTKLWEIFSVFKSMNFELASLAQQLNTAGREPDATWLTSVVLASVAYRACASAGPEPWGDGGMEKRELQHDHTPGRVLPLSLESAHALWHLKQNYLRSVDFGIRETCVQILPLSYSMALNRIFNLQVKSGNIVIWKVIMIPAPKVIIKIV